MMRLIVITLVVIGGDAVVDGAVVVGVCVVLIRMCVFDLQVVVIVGFVVGGASVVEVVAIDVSVVV